jgi:transketolase
VGRFKSCGWNVIECDGHNIDEIDQSIVLAKKNTSSPSIIICKTKIGFGSDKENSEDVHGSPLKQKDIELLAQNLSWKFGKFEIPNEILEQTRKIYLNYTQEYDLWVKNSSHNKKFQQYFSSDFSIKDLTEIKNDEFNKKRSLSTRVISGEILEKIQSQNPNVIIGSADLAKSNCTKTATSKGIKAEDFSGNFIYYGIREHAMAAIMNGIYLHGGLLPI